jgi:hypothetical protein
VTFLADLIIKSLLSCTSHLEYVDNEKEPSSPQYVANKPDLFPYCHAHLMLQPSVSEPDRLSLAWWASGPTRLTVTDGARHGW